MPAPEPVRDEQVLHRRFRDRELLISEPVGVLAAAKVGIITTNVSNTSITCVGVAFGIIGRRFCFGHNASRPYLAATLRHL